MFGITVLCVGLGLFPGIVIDTLAPVVRSLVGEGAPTQGLQPYYSIVPLAGRLRRTISRLRSVSFPPK